jgi:phosphoheptose isomerase
MAEAIQIRADTHPHACQGLDANAAEVFDRAMNALMKGTRYAFCCVAV